ncbi:unnamed protein product [Urochloa humidicola]
MASPILPVAGIAASSSPLPWPPPPHPPPLLAAARPLVPGGVARGRCSGPIEVRGAVGKACGVYPRPMDLERVEQGKVGPASGDATVGDGGPWRRSHPLAGGIPTANDLGVSPASMSRANTPTGIALWLSLPLSLWRRHSSGVGGGGCLGGLGGWRLR